jgi:hypothetical protein
MLAFGVLQDLNSSRFRLMRIGVRINKLLFSRKASLPARDSPLGLRLKNRSF